MGCELLAAHIHAEVAKGADVGADDARAGVDQGEVEVEADTEGSSHARDHTTGKPPGRGCTGLRRPAGRAAQGIVAGHLPVDWARTPQRTSAIPACACMPFSDLSAHPTILNGSPLCSKPPVSRSAEGRGCCWRGRRSGAPPATASGWSGATVPARRRWPRFWPGWAPLPPAR